MDENKKNEQEVEVESKQGCDCTENTCACESNDACECESKDAPPMNKKKEIELLKNEIEELKKELEVSKNAFYKAYADTENTKRRLQQDFETSNKYKLQSFAKEIMPVIDNLERALAVQSESEECINYGKGFQMIYTQLTELLKNSGVSEIEAMNKPFDPNFHQALLQEPVEGVESGMVVEVLQKGYMYKDRILRPTLVKVSE